MRVLAVTGDTQLQLALLSMLPDWELQTVSDGEASVDEARGASLALLDCGSTQAGLDVARALHHDGVTIPCVVIGEDSPPDDAAAHVLLRPFTLDQLGDVMSSVAEEARALADGCVAPIVVPDVVAPEPEAIVAPPSPPPANDSVVPLAASTVVEDEPQPAEDTAQFEDDEYVDPMTVTEISAIVEPITAPADVAAAAEEAASLFADLGWGEPQEPVGAPVQPAKPLIAARPAGRPHSPNILPERAQGIAARKRLRRKTSAAHPVQQPGSILQRLAAAEESGRQLEALLAELPVLTEQR
ncbi:MAG TPA: hypothetical protein VM600_05010, partial [Actinomycetota bacterium]|nr:hypothetical protein [Actinomycetota bacterium]